MELVIELILSGLMLLGVIIGTNKNNNNDNKMLLLVPGKRVLRL